MIESDLQTYREMLSSRHAVLQWLRQGKPDGALNPPVLKQFDNH